MDTHVGNDTANKTETKVKEAGDWLAKEAGPEVSAKAKEISGNVQSFVTEQPVLSALAAVGLGFAMAQLFSRR